jgi:hypothetical protein
MNRLLGAILAVLCLLGPASAQVTSPVPNQPVQFNPINSFTVSATSFGTAVVTIPGVQGTRIHLYSVRIWCGANPGDNPPTTLIPAVLVTDAGVSVSVLPGIFFTAGPAQAGTVYRQFPLGDYRWSPGLTMGVGTTVVITGNNGNACGTASGQFTFMSVQADQF